MTASATGYTAAYCSHRGEVTQKLRAANRDEALDEVTDDLSRIVAEGRPLPSHVDVYEQADDATTDEPLLVGTLKPRKG